VKKERKKGQTDRIAISIMPQFHRTLPSPALFEQFPSLCDLIANYGDVMA
jgi:hypothetical protein